MSHTKSTIQSLDDLYALLQGQNGLGAFKQRLQKWEFDLQCVVDDIKDPDSDIKDQIPPQLFNNIFSLIHGDSLPPKVTQVTQVIESQIIKPPITNSNNSFLIEKSEIETRPPPNISNQLNLDPQIIKLRDVVSSTISDTIAVKKILHKITDEEVN